MRRAHGGLAGAISAGLLSAALAAAASRPWGLGLLGLCCYAPAFAAIATCRRPLLGAVTAGIASLGVASVGYEATVGIFPGIYLVALLAASLPFVVVGAVAVRFANAIARRRPRAPVGTPGSLLALACLWTAAEFLPARPELLGVWALPLSVIGYSQIDLPTAQLATLSSVSAVSAFLLLVNAGFAGCWLASAGTLLRRRVRPGLAAMRTVAPVLLILGLTALSPSVASTPSASGPSGSGPSGGQVADHPGTTDTLRLHLVQPNLPASVHAAADALPAVEGGLIERLLGLTADLSGPPPTFPRLTLLPEVAWPQVIDPRAAKDLAPRLAGLGPILFGAVSNGWTAPAAASAGAASAPPSTKPPNANSLLLSDAGAVTHVYDKRRLVPIAESRLLAGRNPVLVEVAGHRVAPLICYDIVFPADVRASARAGAELLAVHTDDSFAARGDVPLLHLRVARMRAVETGLPVALVSNTGPSALIAPDGRLLAATRPLEATTLSSVVPTGRGATPYLRFGDWIGSAAVALSIGVGAVSVAGGGAGALDLRPT